jgi:threonine-phosphate decarboxylase
MKAMTMEIDRTEHGGNIHRISKETGMPVADLVDFSASINPLGISDRVRRAVETELENLVHYPDSDAAEMRHKIGRHNNIDPGSVICGNGSTELIYLVPAALKPVRALVTAPTFSEYERAVIRGQNLPAGQAGPEPGARIKELILKEENGYKIIPGEFIEAMQGCDMAFLCNPNNPTGHLLGKKDVLRIAEAARELECFLVVDEAFIDFCRDDSVIGHVQDNPFLIVMRSMTKFYAITGLRAGYGVFHPEVVNRIKEFKEPWTVNTLAQKAAVTAMDDRDYTERTMDLISNEKKFIERELNDIGVEFLPSSVNFYLLKTGDSGRVCQELKGKRIIARDCSNFRGLDDSYIRVAVRSRRENEMLISGLSMLCAKGRS